MTTLESGEPTPSDPDGTASFVRRGGNGSVLVNNHEIGGGEAAPGAARRRASSTTRRPAAARRRSRSTRDGNRVARVRQPRRHAQQLRRRRARRGSTWLTCEETEALTGQTKRHGYVFEVDPYDQDANRDPKPIKALGRYAHEARRRRPATAAAIYLTEDAGNPNGLLYRWTAARRRAAARQGRRCGSSPTTPATLEAMQGARRAAARTCRTCRSPPSPARPTTSSGSTVPDRDATTVSTRKQFTDDQVTRSRKLEGMWWGDGGAYFVCLASPARGRQRRPARRPGLVPRPATRTRSSSSCTSPTPRRDQDNDPDGPDNITVSPYGGLILAEDGEGKQHLVGSTDDGEAFFFARNDHPDDSEFTGPTFSQRQEDPVRQHPDARATCSRSRGRSRSSAERIALAAAEWEAMRQLHTSWGGEYRCEAGCSRPWRRPLSSRCPRRWPLVSRPRETGWTPTPPSSRPVT